MTHPRHTRSALAAAFAATCIGSTALAHDLIGLDLRPSASSVAVGDIVAVGIYAVREPTGGSGFVELGDRFSVVDLFFNWNPQDLRLLGVSAQNEPGTAPELLTSGFVSPSVDYTGINEASPPADGTGYYAGLAITPVPVAYEGTLVATFRFQVLREFASTSINPIDFVIVPANGDEEPTKVVWGPGYILTGSLSGAVLTQGTGNSCPANLVTGPSSPSVDGADLAFLLGAWGAVDSPANLVLNSSSPTVDGADLAFLLGAWGSCGG